MTISSLTPVEEKYSSVKQLIELGKEKGYLLYDEIYEMLPEEVVSLPDELDEIYLRFADLGVGLPSLLLWHRLETEIRAETADSEDREQEVQTGRIAKRVSQPATLGPFQIQNKDSKLPGCR